MTIFKVTELTYDENNNEIITVTEFSSEEEAVNFAAERNLDAPTTEERATNPEVIIPDVTPRQMRQALVLSGISIDTINSTLASLPEPTKSLATIEWEYSISFQRSRPLVAQMGALLGISSSQLDDLWRLAGTL